MDSPYITPSSSEAPDPDRPRKRRFWKRMIWVSVIGTLLPPVLGLAGTVFGMMRAFATLAASGTADTEALAKPIASTLLATVFGLLLCVPSVIFLIVSIVRFRANAPGSSDQR